MLDTVILTLSRHDFTITQPERFTPSADILHLQGCVKCTQHVVHKTIYYPRLTLTRIPSRAAGAVMLRIEASLPKLVFGNNFDELTDDDLP